MGENSAIAWCHHTFNPWWGCQKVSPGCEHCYAEGVANRLSPGLWGPNSKRRLFGEKYWNNPYRWERKAKGEVCRVFTGSMCDVFEDREDLVKPRARLLITIADTPGLTWLVLTKRPENVMPMVKKMWGTKLPPNVWMLTTFENQTEAEKRMPHLMRIPVSVRGVSAEPLLGPLDLKPAEIGQWPDMTRWMQNKQEWDDWKYWVHRDNGINWVIAGGESNGRPMDEDWVRSLRDQCAIAGVPFFYKQRIDNGVQVETPELDGRTWTEFPT